MRRVSIALLISLFTMTGSTAFAVDFEDGFYWGANLGISDNLDACNSLVTPQGFNGPTGCDDTDLGWQLFLGWQPMKWISLEGGYTDLGTASTTVVDTTSSAKVKGFHLNGLFTLPLLEKIGLYGTVGAFLWDADVSTASRTQPATKVSESGTDYYYGLALRYPLTKTIGVALEGKKYIDVGKTDAASSDFYLWSMGLTFRL